MSEQALPVPTTQQPSQDDRLRNHHVLVWNNGKRGGGSVPADFGWNTNPKQWQEENGSAAPSPTPG
jgi:hypothetical protein